MGRDGGDSGSEEGGRQPLLSGSLDSDDEPWSPPKHHPVPGLSRLGPQDSVLVSGRIGRLQSAERIMAFTDATLAIICTSCAVPLWANGTKRFNPVRLVPFITTFFLLSRLWQEHCQDFSHVQGVDEWLAQVNTMWIAALSFLPFAFVVLFVPTDTHGHVAFICVWVVTLLLVAFTSFLLSRATRRLSPVHEGDRGWQGRAVTLTVALLEAGVVVVGLSLLAWKDGIDILTDSYKDAFKPGHVPATAVVLLLGLIIFWLGLAGRLNFLLLSWWLGPSSAQSFDGPVPRVRVEIFSDGVYAAAATGLMIELLSGLLKEGAHGGSGGQSDEERQSVWPGLVNYLYCFHIVAVLHRSHQNIVAKIPAFNQRLLAINALVCLFVAFIPTLSTILDGTWGHDSAALTTAAGFLLCASLVLLALLAAALKATPMSEAPEHLGVHEDPDALLSDMLGRPLGVGGTAIGGLMSMGSPMGHEVDEEKGGSGNGGEGYVPPLHYQPRLFNDPSCLPRDRSPDPALLRRLQGIRDGYELRSAAILPTMALALTLLTLACQLAGHTSRCLPLAFLPTFFVYSVERHILRPRAARQIHRVQRELRRNAQRSSSSSYSFSAAAANVRQGSSGGALGGWRPLLGGSVLSPVLGLGGESGGGPAFLPSVAEGGSSVEGSSSRGNSSLAGKEEEEEEEGRGGGVGGEVKEEEEEEEEEQGQDSEESTEREGMPLGSPRHVHFSSSTRSG